MSKLYLTAILLVILIISSCNNSGSLNKLGLKKEQRKLPDSNFCEYVEDGWSCFWRELDSADVSSEEGKTKLNKLLSKNFTCKEFNPKFFECTRNLSSINKRQLYSSFENLCNEQGGEWIANGLVPKVGWCYFPYEDAGKKCTNSGQCKGKCITDDKECKSNCFGKCSKYPLNDCDNYIEVFKGELMRKPVVICD